MACQHQATNGTMTVEEGWSLLRRVGLSGLAQETLVVGEAAGRVLASEAAAAYPVPPFDTSRMDGYGVGPGRAPDPLSFRVVSHLCAGSVSAAAIGPGEAVRIMTGAPVPPGVVAVVPFEEVLQDGAAPNSDVPESSVAARVVGLAEPPAAGNNIFRAGSQMALGQVLCPRGTTLGAETIGRIASTGVAEVTVFRRPRLGILPTGSELSPLGEPLPPGRIFNSNLQLFKALARIWEAEPVAATSQPDEVDAISEAVRRLHERTDCIVATGGIAGGDRDLMRAALGKLGVEILIDGVDVHPGGRMVLGLWRGKLIFGLSGSPGAALAMATLFLRPALHLLGGRPWPEPVKALLKVTPEIALSPRRALPVRVRWSGACLEAEPVPRHDWQREFSLDGVPGFWVTPTPPADITDGMPIDVRLVEQL